MSSRKPVQRFRPLTVLMALAGAVVLFSGAIAAALIWRPFYYVQIGPLGLEEETGLTREEIRTAFDEVMDYCMGQTDEFSAGRLRWSESGRAHFDDVRLLFRLDLLVLMESALLLIILLLLGPAFRWKPAPLLGHGPGFWTGAVLGGAVLAVGLLAALDFDRAFTLFHALFFPGKDNWRFDPAADQIITILPQEVFRNYALLILGILVAGCAILIARDVLRRKSRRI